MIDRTDSRWAALPVQVVEAILIGPPPALPPGWTPPEPPVIDLAAPAIETPNSVFAFDLITDSIHQIYFIFGIRSGNTTWVDVYKTSQNGTPLGHWRVNPPPDPRGIGYKFDGGSLGAMDDGTGVVPTWEHQILSEGVRYSQGFAAMVPFGFVPWPNGRTAIGAFADLSVLGGPAPDPTPTPGLTKAEVVAAVHEEMMRLVVEGVPATYFAQLSKAAKNAVVSALTEATNLDPTHPGILTVWLARALAADGLVYHSEGFYNRLMETQFMVLRDHDVLRAVDKILNGGAAKVEVAIIPPHGNQALLAAAAAAEDVGADEGAALPPASGA